MLKMLGALLLMTGAAGLGFGAAAQLTARATALRALVAALNQMERELSFRLTPMPELLWRVAHQAEPPAALFFAQCHSKLAELGERSLSELWRQALEEEPDLLLNPEERQIMRTLGDVLGRFDAEEQRLALRTAAADLGRCLEQADRERSRMGRVYGTLGMGAGAMLVILLL